MFSQGFRQLLGDEEAFDALKAQYRHGRPFPHIVLPGNGLFPLFENGHALTLAGQFPKPDPSWWKYDNTFERKFAKNVGLEEYPAIANAINEMNGPQFVTFLEKLTGISGLIPDPLLHGGGLHQIAAGGKLDIHADYNVHPFTKLDRRVNVLLYLNPGWDPNWGGALELWPEDMSQAEATIMPTLGTLAIFNSTDKSYHGHPRPLECPEGVTRKSVALYYYTNGRPESERSDPHSTMYKRRPGDPLDPETEKLRAARAQGRLNG